MFTQPHQNSPCGYSLLGACGRLPGASTCPDRGVMSWPGFAGWLVPSPALEASSGVLGGGGGVYGVIVTLLDDNIKFKESFLCK